MTGSTGLGCITCHTFNGRKSLGVPNGLPYAESLDASFAALGIFDFTRLSTAVFEDLRSRGLNLISDSDLRLELIDLFDQEHARMVQRNEITREEKLFYSREYALEHFRMTAFGIATPIDYATLLHDDLLMSHLDYQLGVLNPLNLRDYGQAIEKIDVVIESIQTELENR